MTQHEPPLTRLFWESQANGTLRMEHRVVPQTSENSYRQIDAVIWPGGNHVEDRRLDVAGKDVISVQTKLCRLSIHLIGQAFFSRELLLRHAAARSVRTVALCTADDAVLRPVAEALGVEVVVTQGHRRGKSGLKQTPSWVTRWHQALGNGRLISGLPVVKQAADRGQRKVYAVIDLDQPPGRPVAEKVPDLRGHDLVTITTTPLRPGMFSIGEALLNRILLLEKAGARSVRSVVLCGQHDAVMAPLAAEQDIEIVVMEPETP